MMTKAKFGVGILTLLLCLTNCIRAQQPRDRMELAFRDPPTSAKPHVWWHWMNGNITQEGIKLDLDWMRRVGIGGFTVFEGSIDTPQVVQKRLVYMTPDWKVAFRYATVTANKLRLEMSIASSPGWSETGGPWVPPSQGMKKMVWNETIIDGGKRFDGSLPQPPDTSGTFQDYSIHREGSEGINALPRFYADSAVVAYRLPPDAKTQAELRPSITSSGGQANSAALSDGNIETVALALPYAAPGKNAWVQFEYPQPQTIQAVTLATLDDMASIFGFVDPHAVYPRLEASDDGFNFRHVIDISMSSVPQRTEAFDAVTARFFRIVFPAPAASSGADASEYHAITELILSPAARVDEFEKRAGFATVMNYYSIPIPPVTAGSIVHSGDVLDLTRLMKPDGSLQWDVPPGKWAILRIGYSLTGHENGPAPAEATGLEVDKLNRQYVKNYVDEYLKTYSDTVGPSMTGKTGITFMLTDSAETGAQNWTDNMLDEFRQRRGYDAHPWLPALTGVIVESPQASVKFLWDFRRTIAELFAQNHYGEIASELHRNHMGYYSEALEYHRPSLGDDMEMRRSADIPMGAMWTFMPDESPTPTYIADLRGAASVAHIYGRNLVGAESMTSNGPAWGWSPNTLKPIADLELALGVNRFMIHESAHQPLVNEAPGLTLGHYGLWFNRNQTWAEQAGSWVTYLARSSYMLQQGHFYGDVAYFYGEEGPLTAVFGLHTQEDAPQGYGFDFVNSDVILNHLSFQDGRLHSTGGTNYRILFLGGTSSRVTLPVLRKIRDLVTDGAVVVGQRPIGSPSLADDPNVFKSIADELWGEAINPSQSIHLLGRGKVYSAYTANQALTDLKLGRDFEYSRPEPDTELMFVHRKLSNGQIYFVDNRKNRVETLNAIFRVSDRIPELWHPDTGKISPVSYRVVDGRTKIPLSLDPNGTVFVVFRKPLSEPSHSVLEATETSVMTLDRVWTVSFQRDRGVSKSITLDKLVSWSNNSDLGVKYFSGTATYTTVIQAKAGWFKPGRRLWLDLGDVRDLADVTLNGLPLGVAWKVPYRVDATSALRTGPNKLAINVTNLWVNRLIGDQQPDVIRKYTFTTFKPYTANSPLLPSGLLGPVQILSIGK